MKVTSQCRVDASPEWVRAFLLAGTREDDVTVEGDVVEVRQRDRLIDLVVRNRVIPDAEGGTVLDVDADLRLLGLARVVGGVFHRRVRRTLERGLDRLPTAMEQALQLEQAEGVDRASDAGAYGHGIVEDRDPAQGGAAMSDDHEHEHRERHDAEATTVSGASQDAALESDKRVPEGARESLEKTVNEAGAGDGVVDKVKRVGQEVDRTFSGEYEAREDEAAARMAEDGTGA